MRAIGIILAGGNNNRMRELSNKRAIAAMPIAGSYRSIDFALSNMASSHIQRVAVLTQYNARSLNEHLSSSKWWDFGRKQGGLFVFTPTITKENSLWYQGTADAIYQNLEFLKSSHEPYVVIASGDCVYKMDYNKVLEYHIANHRNILACFAKTFCVPVMCTEWECEPPDTAGREFMQMVADCLKVLVGAEAHIDLFVIPGVIAVRIGFKDRGKIDGIGAKFFDVRNPVIDL